MHEGNLIENWRMFNGSEQRLAVGTGSLRVRRRMPPRAAFCTEPTGNIAGVQRVRVTREVGRERRATRITRHPGGTGALRPSWTSLNG